MWVFFSEYRAVYLQLLVHLRYRLLATFALSLRILTGDKLCMMRLATPTTIFLLMFCACCSWGKFWDTTANSGVNLDLQFNPAFGSAGTLLTLTSTSGFDFSTVTAVSIGGTPAILLSQNIVGAQVLAMPGSAGPVSATNAAASIVSAGVFTLTSPGIVINQQGSKLVGTGNVGAAQQGFSVSLCADGNTAIMGALQITQIREQPGFLRGRVSRGRSKAQSSSVQAMSARLSKVGVSALAQTAIRRSSVETQTTQARGRHGYLFDPVPVGLNKEQGSSGQGMSARLSKDIA